jgi:putative thioredoxin
VGRLSRARAVLKNALGNNVRMTSEQFSRPGAVDLSGLSGSESSSGGSFAVDVADPSEIAALAEASLSHLVVLSLWSSRAPTSVQVNELLTKLADSYEGRFLLARVDVDAAPEVAQAVGAQGVPFIVALLRGQPVAQIPPTTNEAEARTVLDQLVQAAVANGVTGRAKPRAAAPEDVENGAGEGEEDPRFAEADAALAADDIEGAIAAYQRIVDAAPSDADALGRLAGAKLMQRTKGADADAARAAAAADLADVDAQLLAADLDVVGGHVDDAFRRLIETVRRTAGDDRDRVREHLLELFEAVGPDDPRVTTARRALSSALF